MTITSTEISEPAVALVVAAGSGVRLAAGVPKALVPLAGRPLVAHAVAALAAGGVTQAVVLIPAGYHDAFLTALTDAPIEIRLAHGGAERQDTVRMGLELLRPSSGPVLVHDAARPLVPPAVVARVIDRIRAGAEAVVPVVPVVDTIRRVADDGHALVDRSGLYAVQTPQGFTLPALRAGHRFCEQSSLHVTDDATACELAGTTIELVPGSSESLKVTTPADLTLATAVLAARSR